MQTILHFKFKPLIQRNLKLPQQLTIHVEIFSWKTSGKQSVLTISDMTSKRETIYINKL